MTKFLGIPQKKKATSFERPMLATVKSVDGRTDRNIPAVTFTGDDGESYKVVDPEATYLVENGVIEIEVKKA